MPTAEVESIVLDEDTVLLYPLQAKQKEFMRADAKYQVFGGSKGGGKSYACRAKCVRSALARPRVRGLALRRTMPEIEENMVTPMISELTEGLGSNGFEYNGSKHILRFHNDSTLRFSYCENMKHVLRYQGIQYDFICIEELTQWRENEWRVLMNCLRTTNPHITPYFFGSTNAGGVGHGWVKRLFISRDFRANERPEQYQMIRAKLWDNPILVQNDPDYVSNLQALPETLRRAYLDGDWNVFEGQFFNEYREDVTICDPFFPVGVKRRIIAVDYGRAAPACALWMALLNDGRVVVYRELYGAGMNYDQFALRIKVMCAEGENIDYIVVDPAALDKKSEDTGQSIKSAFKKAGLPKTIPAINSRIDGWNTVRRYLMPQGDINNHNRSVSMLLICRNCDNLIRTLPEMIHDSTVVEDLDTTLEDHAVDALRYGLMNLTVSIGTLSEVASLNRMLEKGFDATDLTPKEREYRSRGISDDGAGGSILGKEF